MKTPVFQQLTGLLVYLKEQLREDSHLVTGDGATDLGYSADEVCKALYPHKLFEQQGDGIALFVDFGKVVAPALAIYIETAEYANLDGGIGMECQLGIQYVFQSRVRDITTQAFSAHFAMTIWWAICEIITTDMQLLEANSVLRSTYHIKDIGLEGMRLLPPFSQSVRAFEATGSMDFKRPIWDTGDDSHQVVDLASVYTDHNEKGDTGADPLIQSKFEPA